MKINLCVQRKMDSYHRLAVPTKICKQLGWEHKTVLNCLKVKDIDNKFFIFEDLKDFLSRKNFTIDDIFNLQTKRMDVLKRIVIPKYLCDELGLKNGDLMNVKFIDNYIIVEKT